MAKDNEALVKELIAEGHLKTPRIIEAFRAIDRKDFVPENLNNRAYVNDPLPIGHAQTISQPLTVAFMLELLNPLPGDVVLDIGAGSGWQTTLLAHIVGNGGADAREPDLHAKVIALERIPELEATARTNIEKYGYIKNGVVELAVADASQGVPLGLMPRYGFTKIIAAASATEIPLIWKRQLAVGGRIVAPVGESIMVLDKTAPDRFVRKEYKGFRFVPLVANSK